jgi:hypothetical protein
MYAYFTPRGGMTLDDKMQNYYQYAYDNNIHAGDTTSTSLPNGGTINQVLKKNSATDQDASWGSIAIPTGGTQGQALAKNSVTAFDVSWQSIGLPIGGATNQVLAKSSGADFATAWVPVLPITAVPTGGTTNQVLAKASGTDYATSWQNVLPISSIPTGGTTNQILAKTSGTDYNDAWIDNTATLTKFTPSGTLVSTNTQAALAELDTRITSIPTIGAGTGITFPTPVGGVQLIAVDTTVALLNSAQTFTSAKTFTAATLLVAGASTGVATLAYPSTATNATLTFPAITDTLVSKTSTDILTNKTFDTANNTLNIQGVALTATGITGTNALVLANNPVLTSTAAPGVRLTTTSVGVNQPSATFDVPQSIDQLCLLDICRGIPTENATTINTKTIAGIRFRALNGNGVGVYNTAANIQVGTEESYDATHGGAFLRFMNTTAGTTTPVERFRLSSDGSQRFTGPMAVGNSTNTVAPTWNVHVMGGNAAINAVGLDVSTTIATAPGSNAACAMQIFKGTTNYYLMFVFNDAGTTRYKYLQLNGTGSTWATGTTVPT